MDRPIVYTQEQGRSADFMFANRSAMVGLAKIAEALLGSSTWLVGLACTATAPASLSVDVAPGQIYSNQPIDATAYGVLAADTAHSVLKQGVALDVTTLACPAPVTSGYSINYLVQVAFQETDATNAVLPFYNSANPSQPYSGQGNSGAALPTERQDKCIVAVKAGAAATTGSQTTPAPDAGYIGAYVVTVAYGQTTITSTSIGIYPNAPFIPADGVFRGLQLGETQYAIDTGTANALAIALSPAPTALTPGMVIRFKVAATNTGPSAASVNGLPSVNLYGAGAPLAGGELVAGSTYEAEYDGTNLNLSPNGALPVGTASNPLHALALSLFAGGSAPTPYIKIPFWDGTQKRTLIIQWGSTGAVAATTNIVQNLPITFPTAPLYGFPVMANFTADENAIYAPVIRGLTTTQITIRNTNSLPETMFWFAVGY